MNGILSENQLTIVKEYEFIKPKVNELDYVLDEVTEDCRTK